MSRMQPTLDQHQEVKIEKITLLHLLSQRIMDCPKPQFMLIRMERWFIVMESPQCLSITLELLSCTLGV
uniref:Uncharacterized protein n=1 Tax=Arundo donax TaxID=35708 RepID=A0A0A9B864_ARUDO